MNTWIEKLSSKDPILIEEAIREAQADPKLPALVDLYESLWKMTYANAKDIPEAEGLELAGRIALINEQEDLAPNPPVPVEEVEALDLGGFPEAVFFPELSRYVGLRRLDFWESPLREIPEGMLLLTNLEELNFADGLERLPADIHRLTKLKKLWAPDGEIPEIPESLGRMKHLEILVLDNNALRVLPDFLLEMPALKQVFVEGNPDLFLPADREEKFRAKGIELLF